MAVYSYTFPARAIVPPSASFGTLSISDLLAVNSTSIIDFGREDVFRIIREYLAAVNQIVNDQLAMFTTRTTERAIGVGGPTAVVAQFTDEFGVADAQKVSGAAVLGLPLRKHQVTRQWTYQWMRKHTPQEMAAQTQAAAIADLQKVQYSIRKAFFAPTNFTSIDRLRDNMPLPVKALANADGFPIPPSPSGLVFDPTTHTHYLGTANAQPSGADLDALVRNVTEHYTTGTGYLFLPLAVGDYMLSNQASYPGFAQLMYTDQKYAITGTFGTGANLEPFNNTNRQIGVYRGMEIWVKPWMPTTVVLAFVSGDMKPLAMRVPADLGGDNGDFRAIWDDDQYPTMCEVMEREYGIAVRNRVSAAVLSFGGADTTYVMPTI
jgi:hypothetical protein